MKQIILLGDSVRMQYQPAVKEKLKDVILEVADDLWKDCRMSENDDEHSDPVWISKYIKMSWPRKD